MEKNNRNGIYNSYEITELKYLLRRYVLRSLTRTHSAKLYCKCQFRKLVESGFCNDANFKLLFLTILLLSGDHIVLHDMAELLSPHIIL